MKSLVIFFALCLSIGYTNGQSCPKGFTEQYSYNTIGGGTVNDFKPSLVIRACIQDKSGSAGEQVFWNVKGFYHSYKTVRFIKHIKLTCGHVIDKKVVLYNLKRDESVGGGSFSGDIDLSDNIFKEDCANAKRIDRVWADNFSCELADDDPLMVQEKSRQAQIRGNSRASTTSSSSPTSSTSTPATRTSAGSSVKKSSSSSSAGQSSSGDGGRTQIYDNLNRQMQNNRDTYQAVAGGLQELGAIWQASRERKQAEQDAAQKAREQREAEEKERRAERAQKEAERQAEIAEENRLREEAEQADAKRQWEMDKGILGNFLVRKKTADIPESLKTVYYLVYERNYQNNNVRLKTYTLNKYADGTWMLRADMLKKIQFEPYFKRSGIGELLGFFGSKQQALDAIVKISSSVATVSVDNSFLQLNGVSSEKTDIGFWNN